MRRGVQVLQTRGSDHDKVLRDSRSTLSGMEIGGPVPRPPAAVLTELPAAPGVVGHDGSVLAVPRSWSDLTPSWVTAVLSSCYPGAVVSGVDLGPVEDGTNRRARLRLSYSEGSGPPSIFVKAGGRLVHRLALVALRALGAEARLAASTERLPIEHPRFLGGGFDAGRLATVVVMEDLATLGGSPNEATRALSVAEVRSGLSGLASLHAAYWDRPLPSSLAFLRPWRLGRALAPVSLASLSRGVRLLRELGEGGLMPPSATPGLLERQFRNSARRAADGPTTVLHGDPHPGNTYALAGGRTGFYDWQLVRVGNWSHDVGYFLVGSLGAEERRVHETGLLEGYLEALASHGVDPPSRPVALERYRAAPCFGLATWLHTLAAGSFQPTDVCLATIARFATAYRDLGTHRLAR